jgi:hypothetical protein
MQHTNAKAARAESVAEASVEPAPIWMLVAGIVLLLIALGPSFVKPATTSPVRRAAAAATASATRTADR